VHRAIGLTLTKKLTLPDAVVRAARMTGLEQHIEEATADVGRALDALAREAVDTAPVLRLEYPVAMVEEGHLVSGYVDLIAVVDGVATVLDFKTDRAPVQPARLSHPEYSAQVDAYVRMLACTELSGITRFRGGLLWTETGRVDWL
jgi:ATP-dependent exoDNAse (exonuclease V) beta subunit